MGGLDPAKILMILLVAVIVVGPEKLPRVARQIGGFWRELAKMRERFEQEVRDAMPDVELPKIPRLPARGITGYLTSMMASSTEGAEASGSFSGDAGLQPGPGYAVAESDTLARQGWVSPNGSGAMPELVAGSELATAAPVRESVPAGWHSVGADAPGYASGSLLAPVPSLAPSGQMTVESELSFDEPGWN